MAITRENVVLCNRLGIGHLRAGRKAGKVGEGNSIKVAMCDVQLGATDNRYDAILPAITLSILCMQLNNIANGTLPHPPPPHVLDRIVI